MRGSVRAVRFERTFIDNHQLIQTIDSLTHGQPLSGTSIYGTNLQANSESSDSPAQQHHAAQSAQRWEW